MRGPFIPLCEWFRILPNVFSDCPASPVHTQQHLSFVCTWGKRRCAPPVVSFRVMADNSIYEGLSPVGNLKTSTSIECVPSFATLH